MDGFVGEAESGRQVAASTRPIPPARNGSIPDVMGYHTRRDIPNYWAYAQNFVLQDHMFEPNASWSLPAHLFMVSEWSAACTQHDNPCQLQERRADTRGRRPTGRSRRRGRRNRSPIYAWTDLTYLLHKNNVSGATTS